MTKGIIALYVLGIPITGYCGVMAVIALIRLNAFVLGQMTVPLALGVLLIYKARKRQKRLAAERETK